ncbi:helix-turn-helix domain-containing protein [Streptomyces platensis]|uniref:helix-turn-helix domain-containing protein n=1 Tax=Streptomyces platensis TaxID=58346 RepID=UPI001F24F6F3|nr:helix-turn-helix transcriptional regulator [Streptomyces platensis]MCF3143770.1 helix-turn-helix transcriptional regulator [Streptomyces platensis]
MAHRSQHPVPALPLEVLQICVALRRDLEDVTAVAVRQALADGATWKEIAAVMSAAESTLKTHYSLEKVDKMLTTRMERGPARTPQTAAHSEPDSATATSVHRLLPGQAGYPLSCALSYLRRTSENTVGSLAYLTGVSASYIYRITSGERTPTWEVTKRFALACEAEPQDLMFLWNRAHSLETPPARSYTEAVRSLQAALRGLYLAASRPDLPRLGKTAHLTARAAAALLATSTDAPPTDYHLRWPVVRDLTTALQGDPQAIRPLWEHIKSPPPAADRSDGDGPTWPAAAFG